MVIEFPSKTTGIATLADLLDAVERPWCSEMHEPVIAIHMARVRFAVQTLSGLLKKSPAKISTDWLLSLPVADLKSMALGVSPTFRREFLKASRLLIKHAQFHRDNESKDTRSIGAGHNPLC
jgi:hypothetical protein